MNNEAKNIKRMVSRLLGQKQKTNNEEKKKKKYNRHIRRIEKLSNHFVYKDYIYEQNNVLISHKVDVLVVGGGPAGICASIASSRAGATTMIIERYGCFGGVITTVGMETLGWYRYEGTVDSEGIGREMERLAEEMGASSKWPYNESHALDTERFKIIADNLILKNNVIPQLHTYVVDVILDKYVDNKKIIGVITESKSGRRAIMAKRVIDCTGDADVLYLAGGRYSQLDCEDALGVSTVINLAGINKNKFLDHIKRNPKTYENWSDGWDQTTAGKEEKLKSPYLSEEFKIAKEKNIIPEESENVSICGSWSTITDEGEATNLNLIHMDGYDATDVKDLTRAEIEGRSYVETTLKALRNTLPGFEKSKLRNIAMQLGIRDTRKIYGKYNLKENDVKNQAKFEDTIGIFPEFIDGYNILILPTTGRYFQIPSRALIGDIDNLLVAGRCVAGDAVSHAATRNMMCCCVTGQGAGTIAAISLKNNENTHNINIKNVQDELIKQGARIY